MKRDEYQQDNKQVIDRLRDMNKMINRIVYLFICLCDFFVGPLWWNLLMFDFCQKFWQGQDCKTSRWEPLTLQAGAMLHLSFGAILGATAWRKKDEVEIHNNRTDTTS